MLKDLIFLVLESEEQGTRLEKSLDVIAKWLANLFVEIITSFGLWKSNWSVPCMCFSYTTCFTNGERISHVLAFNKSRL